VSETADLTAEIAAEVVIVSCGEQLRQAREAAGMSLEQAAHRVRLTMRTLAALESEQWEHLGAAIFVRGHLRSYATILGLDANALLKQLKLSQLEPPQSQLSSNSVDSSDAPSSSSAGGVGMWVVILLLAGVGWLLWHAWQGAPTPVPPVALDVPAESFDQGFIPMSAPQTAASTLEIKTTNRALSVFEETIANAVAADNGEPEESEAITAATTEVTTPVEASAAPPFLGLSFRGDSWVEIRATNGTLLENGIIAAGEQRQFAAGQVGQITLGNAAAVELRQNGELIENSRLGRGNVLHIRVSLDGLVIPASAR